MAGFCSDVVNFGLEQVIIPCWFLFRSSSLRRLSVDYFFVGRRRGCVLVEVDLRYSVIINLCLQVCRLCGCVDVSVDDALETLYKDLAESRFQTGQGGSKKGNMPRRGSEVSAQVVIGYCAYRGFLVLKMMVYGTLLHMS